MRKFKIYTYSIVAFCVAFVALNGVVWKCWTENLLAGESSGGDLARMGYIPDSKLFRKAYVDLPVRHLEEQEYRGQPVRVLTLGDSFSNGGGGGKNRYYQDYIASYNRCIVLNIEPYQDLDAFSMAVAYLNNGYLERIRPKYLILSASEKFCVGVYARPTDFSRNLSMKHIRGLKRMGYNAPGGGPGVTFINEGNFKFLLYDLLYHFSDHAYFSKVYELPLSMSLFSAKASRELIFYRDDIRNLPYTTEESVSMLNQNLNTLADLLERKGIKLYFMPCVNKYTLYYKFIVSNPYPSSTFFERLRKLPKRYVLIDTKKLLLEEVDRGIKDVFYPDDSHWSWKAPEKIFSSIKFK